MATTKTKGTNAKIKELKNIKPEMVTPEELEKIQEVVSNINKLQLEIGMIEVRKNQAVDAVIEFHGGLKVIQDELQEVYGTNDVDIQTGVINYPKEDGQADKKD